MISNKRNRIVLQGRVYESTLEHKVSKKGVPYIGGELRIATDEAGMNIIPVRYSYVTSDITRKGQTQKNPVFTVLNKLIQNGNTWRAVGKDNAMKLRVECQMEVNDWFADPNDDDSLRSTARVESGFGGGRVSELSTLPDPAFINNIDPRNDFSADVLITSAKLTEADENGNPAYLTLRCGAFSFKNEIMPFDMVVRSEAGINYFLDKEISNSNPLYTGVRGRLNFSKQKISRVTEAAFGPDVVDSYERNINEWVLASCSKTPYEYAATAEDAESEKALLAEDVRTAIQNRNTHLAEVKAGQIERATAAAPVATTTTTVADEDFLF